MFRPAVPRLAIGPLLLSWLAGCALATAAAVTQPLLLRTDAASTLAQIEPQLRQAVQQAGTSNPPAGPVTFRQLRQVSPGWFAFSLDCDTETACRRVREQLAAQRGWVIELLDDQRRQAPTPPQRSRAR